jgi:membrane-bound inhibitor of C-type lysozyme
MFSRKLTRAIAIGATAIAIGGGAYGIVGAAANPGSGTTTPAASTSATSGQPVSGGRGSNARSGPAAGGAIGKVSSVSTSGFTLLTSAGEKVTVKETSSTTYVKGTKSASASAVTKGKTVLVVGTTDSTTITATQVIVQPTSSGSKTSSKVVPFKPGAPSTAKQVGQIPANYKEGSGTIVSGTTANRATKAALAAYPGGIVDRVVRLSNGEYEVHNIGVNWPHHIFVNAAFKVVGAF